jgi:hypothetical protein
MIVLDEVLDESGYGVAPATGGTSTRAAGRRRPPAGRASRKVINGLPGHMESRRGWVRTNDFCRVNAARPPHAPMRHPASHHIRPGQRPAEPKARGAARGVARHSFWQIAGKTLAMHQHDSDPGAADSLVQEAVNARAQAPLTPPRGTSPGCTTLRSSWCLAGVLPGTSIDGGSKSN